VNADEMTPDDDLVSTVDGFFAAKCGPDVSGEVDRTAAMPAGLWEAATELGLPLIGVDEESGGSGGALLDMLAVLTSAGRHAVPLPLAETHLAGWLLSDAGRKVPSGPMSVVPGSARDHLSLSSGRLSGVVHDVSWARAVNTIVAVIPAPEDGCGSSVVAFDPSICRLHQGQDLAGQPRDTLVLDQVPVEVSPRRTAAPWQWRAALLRTAMIAGALESLSATTLRYTRERVQFGRAIGAFQSVQQHTVTIAQAAEITAVNLWRTAAAAAHGPAAFEICAAKLLANESARVAVRASHQAHGAIGVTREYPLHLLTRRLNAWRQEYGTERVLMVALGTAASRAPSYARALTDHANDLELSWPTT
jgi:acyl-CoA dehydrogenase